MRATAQDTTAPEILKMAIEFFKAKGQYNNLLKTYTFNEYTFRMAKQVNDSRMFFIAKDNNTFLELHQIKNFIGYKLNNAQDASSFMQLVQEQQHKPKKNFKNN